MLVKALIHNPDILILDEPTGFMDAESTRMTWDLIKELKGGKSIIYALEKFENFELFLEWKISEGGNSGIFYFASEEGDYIWQSAPEMQVLDNLGH